MSAGRDVYSLHGNAGPRGRFAAVDDATWGEFGFVGRRNVDCPPFSAAGGGAFRRSGDDAER